MGEEITQALYAFVATYSSYVVVFWGVEVTYEELAKQCQNFAVELLDQTRNLYELQTVLNYDVEGTSLVSTSGRDTDSGSVEMSRLARLKLAIKFKQKRVGHQNHTYTRNRPSRATETNI